ncbi:MAG: YtxH domain-containing protein [Nitrospira sp.]|nr:YtxH domain-containing protein [Nitrospira sp.]HNP31170.1 YtxH domain-containing protein [Nitrospirales bacterium]
MADHRQCSLAAVGLLFFTGGLVGAAVALVLAPQSGRESREEIRQYARKAEGSLHDLTDSAGDVMAQAMDKGREFIKEKQRS